MHRKVSASQVFLAGLLATQVMTSPRCGQAAPAPETERVGVAVLPFGGIDSQGDQYLSWGIAETVSHAMASLDTFPVVDAGQVKRVLEPMKWDGIALFERADARRIADALGARWVLWGGVVKQGAQARLHCQLMEFPAKGAPKYKALPIRSAGQWPRVVFDLQETLSQTLFASMGASVSERQRGTLAALAHPTVQWDAYASYCRAREEHCRLTPEGYTKAIALYEDAVGKDPTYVAAWLGLAESLCARAHRKCQNGQQFQADFTRAVECARKAASLRPQSGEAQAVLAAVYRHQIEDGMADGDSRAQWRVAASTAMRLRPKYARAQFEQWCALGRPFTPEGAGYIKAALQSDPWCAEAYFWLGHDLVEAEAYGEALDLLRMAVLLAPRNARAWSNLGLALGGQCKTKEAAAALRKALEVDPEYAAAWNNLAMRLETLGDIEGALSAYDKATTIDAHYATPWYNRGLLFARQGDGAQALTCYQKAVAIDPTRANAWNNLGSGYWDIKDLARAEEAFRKVIELVPEHPAGLANLGKVLFARGHPAEGEAFLKKAVDLLPEFPVAWYDLGVVLKSQQKKAEAVSALKRFLTLAAKYPDPRFDLDEAKRMLRELGAN